MDIASQHGWPHYHPHAHSHTHCTRRHTTMSSTVQSRSDPPPASDRSCRIVAIRSTSLSSPHCLAAAGGAGRAFRPQHYQGRECAVAVFCWPRVFLGFPNHCLGTEIGADSQICGDNFSDFSRHPPHPSQRTKRSPAERTASLLTYVGKE